LALKVKLGKIKPKASGWLASARNKLRELLRSAKLPKLSNLRRPHLADLRNLRMQPQRLKAIAVIVIVVCLAALVIPLWPELLIRLKGTGDNNSKPTYTVETVVTEEGKQEKRYATDGNRLFVPKIGIDTKILESSSEDVMFREEGTWRDPAAGGNPADPGNMVLAGHRFQYLPPNTTTFYNLDKLALGDAIKVYWEGKEYSYQINNIFEVNPDEVWIKDASSQDSHEITLYTCTPLYTSAKRLVIKATLIT
jgi:sortase A